MKFVDLTVFITF